MDIDNFENFWLPENPSLQRQLFWEHFDPSRSLFLAFGGIWLDEIRREGDLPLLNVPGGSVPYATLGARLFLPEFPETISMVIRAGVDFPEELIARLRTWRINLIVHFEPDLPSARGIIKYGASDSVRTYTRLTNPLPVTLDMISQRMINSKVVHLFDTPKSVMAHIVSQNYPPTERPHSPNPLVIWEPQAKTCRCDTLAAHLAAAKMVDVFSPNHMELGQLFSVIEDADFNARRIEEQAKVFVKSGIAGNNSGCIVVRAAEHGCMVMTCSRMEPKWMQAYHPPGSEKVVDTTGAGNAFLGGYAMGWQMESDPYNAACFGQVAASFTVEQVGFPQVRGEGEEELWNGRSVQERLKKYRNAVLD